MRMDAETLWGQLVEPYCDAARQLGFRTLERTVGEITAERVDSHRPGIDPDGHPLRAFPNGSPTGRLVRILGPRLWRGLFFTQQLDHHARGLVRGKRPLEQVAQPPSVQLPRPNPTAVLSRVRKQICVPASAAGAEPEPSPAGS